MSNAAIKIVTGYAGECLYRHLVVENLRGYCARHGYTFRHQFADWEPSDRHPYWRKHELIRRELSECDWLLWLDADCLVIDQGRSLNGLISEEHDFKVVVEDEPQAGAMLLRNTPWTAEFIDTWWKLGDESRPDWVTHPMNDNWILTRWLQRDVIMRQKIEYLKPRDLITKHVHAGPENGDLFMVHCPGCTEVQKLEVMEQMSRRVIW